MNKIEKIGKKLSNTLSVQEYCELAYIMKKKVEEISFLTSEYLESKEESEVTHD